MVNKSTDATSIMVMMEIRRIEIETRKEVNGNLKGILMAIDKIEKGNPSFKVPSQVKDAIGRKIIEQYTI